MALIKELRIPGKWTRVGVGVGVCVSGCVRVFRVCVWGGYHTLRKWLLDCHLEPNVIQEEELVIYIVFLSLLVKFCYHLNFCLLED